MKLLIVESPTKAKTIQRFLGKDFKVVATLGHIKDLPQKELGVDEETFKARFVFLKGKKKIVERIKDLSRKAEEVLIGTDPDREGEAIAFFLFQEIKKVNPNVKRITFYEVTPEALKEALEESGNINMNLVKAQMARRILDRLIGYKLSPKASKEIGRWGLSVGRVQSPALRLIVERERERQNFKKKSYYYVKALLEGEGGRVEVVYDYRYENPSDAKEIAERIKKGLFVVKVFTEKTEKVDPPRPFITSTLQSTANATLGFSTSYTQKLAQELYEKGLITYPRTDSFRMNEEKAKTFMKFIERTFGREYVGRLRKFKDSPTSQSAHECIRPSSIRRSIGISGDPAKLYDLIFRRTLASLMSPVEIKRQTLEVEVTSPMLRSPIVMIAKGVRIIFDGWSRAYPYDPPYPPLPNMIEGEVLKVIKVFVEERKREPPPRYTEGSLVKTLEKLQIGRPSTYAVITDTLKKRGYVKAIKSSLVPQEVAFQVIDFLKENFPKVVDYRFSAHMEEILDEVEEGKVNWKEALRKLLNEVFT